MKLFSKRLWAKGESTQNATVTNFPPLTPSRDALGAQALSERTDRPAGPPWYHFLTASGLHPSFPFSAHSRWAMWSQQNIPQSSSSMTRTRSTCHFLPTADGVGAGPCISPADLHSGSLPNDPWLLRSTHGRRGFFFYHQVLCPPGPDVAT